MTKFSIIENFPGYGNHNYACKHSKTEATATYKITLYFQTAWLFQPKF